MILVLGMGVLVYVLGCVLSGLFGGRECTKERRDSNPEMVGEVNELKKQLKVLKASLAEILRGVARNL